MRRIVPSRFKKGAAATGVALALIGGFEGLRLQAYADPVGIPTICFGSTKGVKLGDQKTRAECDALLIEEVIEHEQGMAKCLTNPQAIPDGPWVAFTSLTYNIGVGGFCGSTVARRANAGDLVGACKAITMWNKVRIGGVLVPLPGLTRRRGEESAICLSGVEGVVNNMDLPS